jgi:hypothetical protein
MSRQILGRKESLIFYFLVPAIVGFILGWHQIGPGGSTSIWISIVSWILHNEIFWLMGFLSLVIVKFAFKKIGGLLIPRLIVTAIVTLFIARPFFWAAYELPVSLAQQNGVIPETEIRSFVFFDPSMAFLLEMLAIYGPNLFLWILTCIAISRFGDFPYSLLRTSNGVDDNVSEPKAETPGKPTHFLRQLKPGLGTNVLMLKAEKNYVRAITEDGEDLVYYKFGDAVEQFAGDGLQVCEGGSGTVLGDHLVVCEDTLGMVSREIP